MTHHADRRCFDEDDEGDVAAAGPAPVEREAAGTATTEEFRRTPPDDRPAETDDFSPDDTGADDPSGILDVTEAQIEAAAKRHRRGDDEPPAKTEQVSDEEATETLQAFITDDVRALAGQYQITDDELATIGSRDEFDRLLSIMDRAFVKSGEAQRVGPTPDEKPAAEGKASAAETKTGQEAKPAAETEIPASDLLKPYAPTLDPEEMPEIHKELTRLANHTFAQVRKLAQLVQPVVVRTSKQVEDELTAKFDACVAKIPETFRKAIGPAGYTSLPEKSPHREIQDKIAVVMGDLMRGSQARGARMTFETAFERAYRSVLGNQTETIVRNELVDKAKARTGTMSHRPSRVSGAGRSARDQAIEAVKKVANESGLTEALAPAGEQDLSGFL